MAAAAVAHPAELDAIVARHVAARGGQAAIEAVRTFGTTIRIVESAFEVDGAYIATREGRMRIDIFADGRRVFTEALDRGRTWTWNPDGGVRDGTSQGAAALRHGIELPFKLFGLHEVRDRGYRLEFVGREEIAGVDYDVLRLIERQLTSGKVLSTVTVREIRINRPLDPARFTPD